ncbi:MAG: signal peptidase II [Bdellovibrionales bacterium]|nr:signal peptidase II [Bdellovibrionales bacterium]
MTRKEWYLNFSIIGSIWLVDFLTKMVAMEHIRGLKFWGPFGVVLHFNPGAMLGAFSGLPPLLRIVSLSTGGAFLFFIYLAIQYLIPVKASALRYGMSILLGGILGNVTDRILRGSVTDFLLIGSVSSSTPAFNVADAIQWVGYLLIVYSLVKDGNLFWPDKNIRRSLWVNPSFQMRYVGMLFTMGACFVLISGVFFYTYLKVTIDAIVIGSAPAVEEKFLIPFFITYSVIAFGFLLLLFIIGRILSHRTAGPLYAFEKFLEDLLQGKNRKLKLRAGDDFQHLEELSEKLSSILNEKFVAADSDEVIVEKK